MYTSVVAATVNGARSPQITQIMEYSTHICYSVDKRISSKLLRYTQKVVCGHRIMHDPIQFKNIDSSMLHLSISYSFSQLYKGPNIIQRREMGTKV